jgi:hypothetical protein
MRQDRVFLAHASEDKPEVRELYEKLKRVGFNPWLDEVDLLPGQNWQMEISRVISASKAFLAILSSRSVRKTGYVNIELRLALTAYAQRPPGDIFLIPVKLDDCEIPDLDIPKLGVAIRDLQWVDFWKEGSFERLLRALKAAVGISPQETSTENIDVIDPIRHAIAAGDPELANLQLKRVLLTFAGESALKRGYFETLSEANRVPCRVLKQIEQLFRETPEQLGSLYLFKTHVKHPGEAWAGFGARVWLGHQIGFRLDECEIDSFKARG